MKNCKFISGVISARKCKALAVNHVHDHIHIFVGLHPTISVAKLMQDTKSVSSAFIKNFAICPISLGKQGMAHSPTHIPTLIMSSDISKHNKLIIKKQIFMKSIWIY